MSAGASILQIIAAFALVLALIGLMGWALRRFGGPERWMAKAQCNARLKVMEVRYLDPRRKLVLIARDGVEHLLLIGPDGQLVVESGIKGER